MYRAWIWLKWSRGSFCLAVLLLSSFALSSSWKHAGNISRSRSRSYPLGFVGFASSSFHILLNGFDGILGDIIIYLCSNVRTFIYILICEVETVEWWSIRALCAIAPCLRLIGVVWGACSSTTKPNLFQTHQQRRPFMCSEIKYKHSHSALLFGGNSWENLSFFLRKFIHILSVYTYIWLG